MRKLLLLGSLLATMSGQAQETAKTTYYWPGERVTELTSGTQYFIYNTTFLDKNGTDTDRSFFLYSNGSALKTTDETPKNFVANSNKYLFTLEKNDQTTDENQWTMRCVDGIVGHGGQTNNTNTDIRTMFIYYWYKNSDNLFTGAKVNSEPEDGGATVDPDETDTKTWAITGISGLNPEVGLETGRDYAWNGNADDQTAFVGNQWARWDNAHPYAFYTVKSIELTQEANNNLEHLKDFYGSVTTAYQMQELFGLAKDASQYSTNAQEPKEGPIKNLIDGDDRTIFHSSWSGNAPNPADPHYIQVNLNKDVNSIYFYTKKRQDQNNDRNRPTEIRISVSANGTDFTPIKTLTNENDGLITNNDYFSPKIESEKAFRYVKFEVLATNTGNNTSDNKQQPYFSFSEFYVFDAAKYELRDKIVNEFPSYIKTATEESITEDWNSAKEYSTALYNDVKSIYRKISSLPYGTALGEYSKPENYDEVMSAAEKLNENDLYTVINSVHEQISSLEGTININQPEPGKFYRIKGASGKYISSEAISTTVQDATIYKLKMTEATDKTTALFLSEGNRITTEKMQNMSRAGVHLQGLGGKYKFTAHQEEIGKYVITPTESPTGQIGGTTDNPLYDYSATSGAVDQVSDSNDAKCAWTLEEVIEENNQPTFSRTIGDAGYATLGAPVALNIPDGVKAYTVTVNEDQNVATLHEVTGIIPAGCGVVLEKTGGEGTYNFTFAAGADAIEGNRLVPLYTETTVSTDINAYVLANKANGIGFYQLDPKDRTIGANKAYLVLPSTLNHVRSITIGGPTTGIEETVANGNEAEEYYDLQGRRVLNPTKGIYVTKSGKKVIINK